MNIFVSACIGLFIGSIITCYENRNDIEATILHKKDPHISINLSVDEFGNVTLKQIQYIPLKGEINRNMKYIDWVNKNRENIIKYDKNIWYVPRYKVEKDGRWVINNAVSLSKAMNKIK